MYRLGGVNSYKTGGWHFKSIQHRLSVVTCLGGTQHRFCLSQIIRGSGTNDINPNEAPYWCTFTKACREALIDDEGGREER